MTLLKKCAMVERIGRGFRNQVAMVICILTFSLIGRLWGVISAPLVSLVVVLFYSCVKEIMITPLQGCVA